MISGACNIAEFDTMPVFTRTVFFFVHYISSVTGLDLSDPKQLADLTRPAHTNKTKTKRPNSTTIEQSHDRTIGMGSNFPMLIYLQLNVLFTICLYRLF